MNKTVIITGGATGIGRDIVKSLVQKGYNVIATYFNSVEEAKSLSDECKNFNLEFVRVDVRKRIEINNLVEYVINKYKKIDILINNAGICQFKFFDEISDDDWNNMINTNLTSAFMLSQEVSKYMIKEKFGVIINISSIWGLTGASCEVHYAVSKAGVDALTKSLAKELGLSNIRVNSIAPGLIDTRMNNNLSDLEKEKILEEIPLNKIGSVKDISKTVEWIIENEYLTGQIISVNGGWLI